MDPRHGTGLLSTLIPGTYARQGAEAIAKRQKLVTSLLSERRMPQHGWDDANIESLLQVSFRDKARACRHMHGQCMRTIPMLVCLAWDT